MYKCFLSSFVFMLFVRNQKKVFKNICASLTATDVLEP